MRKRCCILYNKPAPDALPDEMDIIDQVVLVEENLARLGMDTFRKGITMDFLNEIEEVKRESPDFVFNLVESISNKGQISYFAPAILGLSGLKYSGCPLEAIFITSNKHLASRILNLGGVTTPLSLRPDETGRLHYGRKYIVKPVWEDGSMGITSESVFTWLPGDEVRLADLNPSEWIIEEFIDGREFNISMFSGKDGPIVLPPAEIEFRDWVPEKPKIVDYKAKWETDSFEYRNSVRVFPDDLASYGLDKKLREICLSCWNILKLRGYARVDIRCDQNGNPYVLEVNANPCISPDSGFIAACKEAGYDLKDVFEMITSDLN